MRPSEPSWQFYRGFLAAAAEGSLSGAARALGVSQPTLGRKIAALEAALGKALFTRSSNGLILTEAGSALHPHAEAMQAAAAAMARAIFAEDEESGVVRSTCSELMGGTIIPPILAEMREAHSRLQIELVLTNRNEDILRRDADIAVRMARPTQQARHGQKVGVTEVGLFASKAYIQKHGRPITLGDRPGHTFIGFDRMPPYADRVISDLPIARSCRCYPTPFAS